MFPKSGFSFIRLYSGSKPEKYDFYIINFSCIKFLIMLYVINIMYQQSLEIKRMLVKLIIFTCIKLFNMEINNLNYFYLPINFFFK